MKCLCRVVQKQDDRHNNHVSSSALAKLLSIEETFVGSGLPKHPSLLLDSFEVLLDKEDIYDLLEHFYGEKVATANKRKITEIYKKRDIIIGTIVEKTKGKSKRKKKIQIKINE